jgi:signal transduction histidine kinase
MAVQPTISELTAARSELIASQRQAHLGSVTAMLAHELNNLATPVLTRAQDALDRNDTSVMREALTKTVINVGKAVKIAEHLIDLARATPPDFEESGLGTLIDAALLDTVRPPAKDGIELSLAIPAALRVRANRLLLEQLFVHLLTEARRAIIDRAGRISITARGAVDFYEIEIYSNGRTYTPEYVESALRPWLDTAVAPPPLIRDAAELPLRVIRLIIDAHGATIAVSPREPHGCSFLLRWPAAT